MSPAIMSSAVPAQKAYGESGLGTDPDENILPLVGCSSVTSSPV